MRPTGATRASGRADRSDERGTERVPAGLDLLHRLFEARADAQPSRPAVDFDNLSITYGQLEARANQLAHHLRQLGVGRGACVALMLERSVNAYVSLLATLKAGAAYVPIDPGCPPDRVQYILDDCTAQVVLTTPGLAMDCCAGRHVVCLERDRTAIGQCSRERPAPASGSSSRDLCYVVYTSGRTGRPKGVEVEHRSVCNFVRGEGQLFRLRPADRVYQGLPLAFDASVEEVWLAFFAGATLVVGTREMVRAGPDLGRHLAAAKVTVVSAAPTPWSMVAGDVPTLRLLILGGEACPQDLVRRWWSPHRRLVTTYGPTEATVVATWAELHPDKPVSIGRPLPNYRVHVLDEARRPVPLGVPGELYIGGVGVARGYRRQPELTRQRFLPDPFTRARGARLYRTGDRVCWRPDGELEFLGRLDARVERRGFRNEVVGGRVRHWLEGSW